MTSKVNQSFVIFTIGVICILLLPELIREGMFMDGLVYATLGHNMAHGIGTLWQPSFSEVVMYQFYEHPPLAFGIQSLLFKIFGSAFFIEKVFSLSTALGTAAFIAVFWRLLAGASNLPKPLYWLPIFLWIVMPHCFWAYKNNMLENTMGLFSILAAFLLIDMVVKQKKWLGMHILGASALLVCSFFTKGFPGLYPLGVLFLFFVARVDRTYSFKKMVGHTSLLIIGFAILMAFVLQYPPVAENLEAYINSQVMGSLNGERVVVSSRWHIMAKLANELYFAIGLTFLIASIAYLKGKSKLLSQKPVLRNLFFFTLVGLSASAPIMISPKQLSFYVVPSLPYFAMAFAAFLAPIIGYWIDKIQTNTMGFKLFRFTGWALVGIALTLSITQYGSPIRDKEMLHDIALVSEEVPAHTTIALASNLSEDWSLMAYFQRKHFISLDPSGRERTYLLLEKGQPIPAPFERVDKHLKGYQLAKRIDSPAEQ